MSNEKYNIPAGAKPWTPSLVGTADSPESTGTPTKANDASRKVPGVGILAGQPAPVVDDAPKPSKVINLDSDTKTDEMPDITKAEIGTTYCTACGTQLTPKMEIEVSDADKTRWLRHILGESRFTQTYPIFDGRMEITFRSRTTRENDMLFRQLTHELNTGKLPEAPYFASPAYMARMNRLMLILSLDRIVKYIPDSSGDLQPRTTVYPLVTTDTYNNKDSEYVTPLGMAHEQILQDMDEGLVAVLMTMLRRFDVTVSTLVTRSNDSDFWKAAGVGS